MHSVRNTNRHKRNDMCCRDCAGKIKSKTIRSREKRTWKREF